VLNLSAKRTQALAALASRNMQLQCTLQENDIMTTSAAGMIEIEPVVWRGSFRSANAAANLPCGATLRRLCGCYHGGAPAPDAAALMRSRYSAYVLKLKTHLLGTWHHTTAPPRSIAAGNAKWLGLGLKKHTPESADRATVEFVARYKIGNHATACTRSAVSCARKVNGSTWMRNFRADPMLFLNRSVTDS
jgi:SEC-C motif-containing protein